MHKYVVLTRPFASNEHLHHMLEIKKVPVYILPCIQIQERVLSQDEQAYLQQWNRYDWILFTSSNAVHTFMQKISVYKDLHPKILSIGKATSKALASYGISVYLEAYESYAHTLIDELGDIHTQHILLPQTTLAHNHLADALRNIGADVDVICLYETCYITDPDSTCINYVLQEKIAAITFTSPSTITGFCSRIADTRALALAKKLPIVCIGQTTAHFAQEKGFTNIIIAKHCTIESMCASVCKVFYG